ncbi:hypothetical protein D557_4113 [Bordetella holmesii 70147]|nr:hypothetical protein D557_4113 [Bordetella holmesii 70147]
MQIGGARRIGYGADIAVGNENNGVSRLIEEKSSSRPVKPISLACSA